jgi:hypothetical protein
MTVAMVMYTVHVLGNQVNKRQVTLIFTTDEGEKASKGKTDATGVVSMWGPWAPSVRILVDNLPAGERQQWLERPADRYTEVQAPGTEAATG